MFRRSSAAVATSREGLREWLSVRCATLNRDNRNESKKLSCARPGSSCQIFKAGNSSCRLLMGSAIAEVAERSPSLQSRCAASFDHLVCARVQRWRHVEAERPGGLEIDHEVEPGRIDDRQVCWLFAPENPTRINAGLPISVRNA